MWLTVIINEGFEIPTFFYLSGGYKRVFISIFLDPFDCATDPCHLTWLLRDRRNLLPLVKNAICENGRPFWKIPGDDILFTFCP